jgi:hypothetical protein
MNTSHRVALAGLLALAATSPPAWGQGHDNGWYLAVDYGKSHIGSNVLSINSVDKDESSEAWAVRAGYRFTRRFAVDVGYIDIGDFHQRYVPYCAPGPRCQPYESTLSIYGYQVNAIGTWPIARYFHLKGAVRGFHRKMESSFTDPVYGTNGWHEIGTILGIAVGIAVPINESFEIGLDYTDYRGDIWLGIVFGLGPVLYEHESSLATLGLRFNF